MTQDTSQQVSQDDRRQCQVTVYEGKMVQTKNDLQEELDAFWHFGPEILDVEQRERGANKGIVATIEADRGFRPTWRKENELKRKNSIRKHNDETN